MKGKRGNFEEEEGRKGDSECNYRGRTKERDEGGHTHDNASNVCAAAAVLFFPLFVSLVLKLGGGGREGRGGV